MNGRLRAALLLALFAGFLLYGSLYPFLWRPLPLGAELGPLLLERW
jgi:hypothetical protein